MPRAGPRRYDLAVYRHLDLAGLWVVLDLAVLEVRHEQITDGVLVADRDAQRTCRTVISVTEGVPPGSRGVFQASRILPRMIYAGVPALVVLGGDYAALELLEHQTAVPCPGATAARPTTAARRYAIVLMGFLWRLPVVSRSS
ncbi:hypothetical protein A5760_20285 [Mycobacterium colombiense]|uniref:Uncharacterized protein n=1 Tax=Mycobacterium colombiense TaxID=339268 RepID=A0A1A0V9L6_9MYCO|nr:hypothetical protein A5760_20285 [Mycobacterium colombiense]